MFKKLALFTLIAATAFSINPSVAAQKKDLTAKVRMKAFLCYHWDCPSAFMEATGLNAIIAMYGNQRASQVVRNTQTDARFFAARALITEPGSENTDLYKRVLVKIQAQDRISLQNYQQGEILLNTKNLQVLDLKNGEAPFLKINGRPLISKELGAAHAASQNLIFDGVIKAPMNEYKTATDALMLNKILTER